MEGRVEENVLLRPIDIRGVLLTCTPIVWVSWRIFVGQSP